MTADPLRTWSFWFGVQDITDAEADAIGDRLSDALCADHGPGEPCSIVWVAVHKPMPDGEPESSVTGPTHWDCTAPSVAR